MNNHFKKFSDLHSGAEPLLIGNVWNVQSARVFEKAGFKAIATSSAGVAESLGYQDGEEMSFEEYFFIVQRIKKSTPLPFSVDLEAGYGKDTAQVVENIKKLQRIGVAGINIEDSVVKDGKRTLLEARDFAKKIEDIVVKLIAQKIDIFINVRSDTFLLGLENASKLAVERVKVYEKTGVHGLFFPCVTKLENIRSLVTATDLPLNVMCMPELPDFKSLKEAGVKRISMGNFLNRSVYKNLEDHVHAILSDGSFKRLF
jgi:2-methylisocitrate lyase-like PEP mutase family enzyme